MSSTWQAANPEKWREYKAAYYAENKEAIAATKKAWADKNREHLRLKRRERASLDIKYREENKDRFRPKELLRKARQRAKLAGIPFSITLADITIPETCPLLGVTLSPGVGKLCPTSPSLDRIDNKLGYVPGNVWVISHRANCAKSDLSADEIINLGLRLKNRLAEGAGA